MSGPWRSGWEVQNLRLGRQPAPRGLDRGRSSLSQRAGRPLLSLELDFICASVLTFSCLLVVGRVDFSLSCQNVEEKMGWPQSLQGADVSKVRTIYLNEPLRNTFCKNSIR